jgi:hypothetical protein
MFIGKNPNGKAENEVSMTRYTLWHCVMKLAALKCHCNFPFFY